MKNPIRSEYSGKIHSSESYQQALDNAGWHIDDFEYFMQLSEEHGDGLSGNKRLDDKMDATPQKLWQAMIDEGKAINAANTGMKGFSFMLKQGGYPYSCVKYDSHKGSMRARWSVLLIGSLVKSEEQINELAQKMLCHMEIGGFKIAPPIKNKNNRIVEQTICSKTYGAYVFQERRVSVSFYLKEPSKGCVLSDNPANGRYSNE